MNKLIYTLAQGLRRLGFDFHEGGDVRVQAMRKALRDHGPIKFSVELLSDGSWVAESTNVDGIITGGTDKENINDTLKDAVFTYYEIPPQLCNDSLIKASGEPVKVEREVYA